MEISTAQRVLIDEINDLKRKKNAVLLAHNYQRPEIYEVADYIGDSLGLSYKARDVDADLIVFSGVHFMAESAAILNPTKKVIVPTLSAGCAMADMVNAEDLSRFISEHPSYSVVSYVNTTAEVKALSDSLCTSSNAIDVVRNIDNDEIIFVPDKNLANYVSLNVPNKKILPWDGFCPVHDTIDSAYVSEVLSTHPKAKLIAHPESRPDVLKMADFVESTAGMLDVARKDDADEYFVLTECGMANRLAREIPSKRFFSACNLCFDMKKNTLELILQSLKNESPVVSVPHDIAVKAGLAFDKMFSLTKNNG